MKKQLVIITVLAISTCTVWSKSEPGKRPDLAPSKLMRVIFSSSLEDKIITQSIKVKECREKWESIPHSKKKGLPFFRYRPKDRALEELEKQRGLLKDLLASTPIDVNETKSEVVSRTAPEITASNAEAREVDFAMKNLKNVVMQGRKELRTDPTDLEIAERYYNAHVACLASIIEMHDEFIQNINTKYGPAIDKLIRELEALLTKSEKRLRKEFENDQVRQTTEQIKDNQELVLKALRDIRATRLSKLKEWAKNRLPLLSEQLEVARLANDTLRVTKEAKSLITDFGSDYENLVFTPPPLIVFEVDLPDFQTPHID